MKEFPTNIYHEVSYQDLDTIIQQEFGIPGFCSQRIYEWFENDVYLVGETADQGDDESLTRFLAFLEETRKEATEAENLFTEPYTLDPMFVLDRQIELYKDQEDEPELPLFDTFLRALEQRGIIPYGNYLISISW